MSTSDGIKRRAAEPNETAPLPNRVSAPAVAPTSRMTSPGSATTEAFISAMRSATTGVNLITTDGPAGRFGLTVSAMCSVSAEPPMLLVCINRNSPASSAICRNEAFCVNVLSVRQRRLANIFSGMAQPGNAYDFGAAQWWRGATAAPRLMDAIAVFDCVLENAYTAGTHYIYVGRVAATSSRDATPLLYTSARYGFPLTWEQAADAISPNQHMPLA